MMNKSTVTGIIIGVIIASAGGVIANYVAKHDEPSKPEVAEEFQLEVVSTDTDSGLIDREIEASIAAEEAAEEAEEVAVAAPAKAPDKQWSVQESAPPQPTYAEVLSVTPATESQSTPREVCEQVEVVEQAPVKDENQIVGTVAGAIIGGVLGHQVGGGSGKKVATVAGVAAGGYAGKKAQENMQNRNTTTRMETRCETVYDSTEVQRGFDVAYRLNGRDGSVRMSYDPGSRIPVENGQLMIRD